MKTTYILFGLALAITPGYSRQETSITIISSGNSAVAFSGDAASAETMDAKDDPGYAMYKEGYNLVLDEQWKEAREKLEGMIKQFPKSSYVDDAQYWSAFALKHLDKKAAVDAYKQFIKKYPNSNYYDDAVADLTQLESGDGAAPAASSGRAFSYSYSTPAMPAHPAVPPQSPVILERSMRDMERKLRTLNNAPRLSPLSRSYAILSDGQEEKADPETELKIEALYAIGNAKEDDKSFQTLKNVALDFKQSTRLRQAALDALSDFKKYDLMPVYLEIAKHDTAEEMQNLAIDFISSNTKDKNKSVSTLIDLFNAIPHNRLEQKRTIFYFIADVGNDRAVDFLATVARSNDDYDLRREAVYYLGSIGGDKARSALYEILSGKQ